MKPCTRCSGSMVNELFDDEANQNPRASLWRCINCSCIIYPKIKRPTYRTGPEVDRWRAVDERTQNLPGAITETP